MQWLQEHHRMVIILSIEKIKKVSQLPWDWWRDLAAHGWGICGDWRKYRRRWSKGCIAWGQIGGSCQQEQAWPCRGTGTDNLPASVDLSPYHPCDLTAPSRSVPVHTGTVHHHRLDPCTGTSTRYCHQKKICIMFNAILWNTMMTLWMFQRT